MMFSNFEAIERFTGKKILSKNIILLAFRTLAVLFLILSISGTAITYTGESTDSDFVLAIDSSGSMLATDFESNRLEAAKEAALTFVDSVPLGTKIGVISFSGASLVKAEPTEIKLSIKNAINNIEISTIGGTAIGDVIVTSSNLLKHEEKQRTLIILTDGQNNIGTSLNEALEYAKEDLVIVNTIGVATKEGGEIPYSEVVVSRLDEESLMEIAEKTNGKYYRAESEEALKTAFSQIATTKERNISLKLEVYLMFAAIALLLIEFTLMNSKYRTIP